MARNYLITPEVENLIKEVYREHSTWKPKDVRMTVRSILRGWVREYPEKYPDLPLKLKTGWPGEDSVRNKMTKVKPHITNPAPIDKPWSLGCLANKEYHIPPEALPKVMLICEKHFREFKWHITIRQVLWMARLYKIIDDPITLKNFAFMYESHEWLDWVSGNPTPTYTRDIDLTIIQHMAWRIATDKTGEYCADIAKHPFLFRSLQALAKESKEELEEKLKNKDYILCSELTEEEAENEG